MSTTHTHTHTHRQIYIYIYIKIYIHTYLYIYRAKQIITLLRSTPQSRELIYFLLQNYFEISSYNNSIIYTIGKNKHNIFSDPIRNPASTIRRGISKFLAPIRCLKTGIKQPMLNFWVSINYV